MKPFWSFDWILVVVGKVGGGGFLRCKLFLRAPNVRLLLPVAVFFMILLIPTLGALVFTATSKELV